MIAIRRIAAIALLGVVAACTTSNAPSMGARDRSVPIASRAVFDDAQLYGDWHVVARLPDAGPPCERTMAFSSQTVSWGCDGSAYTTEPLQKIGTARYVAGGQEVWLLWIASDAETIVLGNPNGDLGHVLHKRASISAERMAVARKILAFNGYEVSQFISAQ